MIIFLLVIYLAISQVWLNFNYPAFMRLGSPFNIIVPTILTILCFNVYFIVYKFPHSFFSLFTFLNDFPPMYKKLFIILFVAYIHVLFLYIWHKDYYAATSLFYFVLYVHCLVTFILINRAIAQK